MSYQTKEFIEEIKTTTDVVNLWVNEFNEEKAKLFNNDVLKTAAQDPHKPLIVLIDSYGGVVDAMASMVSVLQSVPNPKVMVVTGKAMSCGAILLSCGDIRYCSPKARVMVHEVSSGTWGNINDLKTDIKEVDRLNDYWMGLLAKNCKKSLKELKVLFSNQRREIYLDATQAVKFGIADHIGVPVLKKAVTYRVEQP